MFWGNLKPGDFGRGRALTGEGAWGCALLAPSSSASPHREEEWNKDAHKGECKQDLIL